MLKKMLRDAYAAVPFKRQIFQGLRRLPIPERVYRHLHFTGPFFVEIDRTRGFMLNHCGSVVENELFWSGIGGQWEAKSNLIWAKLCDGQDGLILDVGSNSGVYALIARIVAAEEATIIAVEPIARVAELLRRNIDLNGKPIRIEEVALSNHDGVATIYDFSSDLPYSASIERPFAGADRTYEVQTARGDTLLKKLGSSRVTACKLDVEGHEAAVIEGMRETIRRFSPPMLVEVLDQGAADRIEEAIEGCDYCKWNIDEEHGLIPTNDLQALSGSNWNVLLCRRADFDSRGLATLLC
jgi:FkbM family methyltransferase